MNESTKSDIVLDYEKKRQKRPSFPVRPGMDVRVHTTIREGEKERTQTFEGIVVAMNGAGAGKTFTVRRVVGGIGVERVFPMNSPLVTNVEILGANKVRRSKLTFLRKSNVKRKKKEDQKVMRQAMDEQKKQKQAEEKARREAEKVAAEQKAKAEQEKATVETEKQESETPAEEQPAEQKGEGGQNTEAGEEKKE